MGVQLKDFDGGCHCREVLNRILSSDVHRAVSALDGRTQRRLAATLDLPHSMLTRGPSVATTIRHRVRRRPDDYAMTVAFFLTRGTHAQLSHALDGHDKDPTLEQLRSAVEAIIGDVGARLCALLLAVGVDFEWPAARHCQVLLTSHDHLVLDALGPEHPEEGSTPARVVRDRTPSEEVRKRRVQRRQDRRSAATFQHLPPPRYRRIPKPAEPMADADGRLDPGAGTPDVSIDGAPVPTTGRRRVGLVHRYPDLDFDDPLVGKVILVPIRFKGPVRGIKDRPCVVIAASGRRKLVVRTCYSEGGVRAADWRSFPIADLDVAGLRRHTSISNEERVIFRRQIIRTLGELSLYDWNQL